MEEPDESGLVDLLSGVHFKTPVIEGSWSRARRSRRALPMRLALVAALVAVVAVSAGALAAANGWFNTLLPGGQCPAGDVSCGVDYTRVGIAVDHTTDVTMLNILVKPGLSQARLTQIAELVVQQNESHRVIVYIYDDLGPEPMSAGFDGTPASDSAAAPAPPANLAPYWLMTYDDGPGGIRQIAP